MTGFLDTPKRAALRGVAHLLPAKWRQIGDLIDAPIPATPTRRVSAPSDPAAARLEQVDHVVVVMLENRSFDHMLGYLSLPVDQGGNGRVDVDGLKGPEVNFNSHEDSRFAIHPLNRTAFSGEIEDPDHSARSVDEQLADGQLSGFVSNFARISAARASKAGQPVRLAQLRPLPRRARSSLALVLATSTASICCVPGPLTS